MAASSSLSPLFSDSSLLHRSNAEPSTDSVLNLHPITHLTSLLLCYISNFIMPPTPAINGRPVFGPPLPPRQNYRLKIDLEPEDITNPRITRTLSCPANATFHDLHRAIQVAFSWATTHTYDFKIKDPQAEKQEPPDILTFIKRKMEVDQRQFTADTSDPYWDASGERMLLRLVEDRDTQPSAILGLPAIDSMFDSHRKHRETPEKSSVQMRLWQVFDDPTFAGLPMEYEYDFGDCWEHQITIIGRDDPKEYFNCVDGTGHSCAEDVGSKSGWKTLTAAYRAANPNGEQREKMAWYETQCSNGDRDGLRGNRARDWPKAGVNRRLMDLYLAGGARLN